MVNAKQRTKKSLSYKNRFVKRDHTHNIHVRGSFRKFRYKFASAEIWKKRKKTMFLMRRKFNELPISVKETYCNTSNRLQRYLVWYYMYVKSNTLAKIHAALKAAKMSESDKVQKFFF